jgi:hypothetical protein
MGEMSCRLLPVGACMLERRRRHDSFLKLYNGGLHTVLVVLRK